MGTNFFLILDQGGSSSRAIVFDNKGNRVCLAQQAVGTSRPRTGWVEQDPLEIAASLRSVAAQAVQQLTNAQRAGLVAAGLVCQRSSLVCWDFVGGQPLSPILSWQDTRAHDYLAKLPVDQETIYKKTGLIANAHYGASKMRWCLDHLPAVKQAAKHNRLRMAPLGAYLVNVLVEGAPYLIDPANASRTLLFNIATGQWDPELLEAFGLDKKILPNIASTVSPYGQLLCADSCIDFRLLSGDQSAAAFASGKPEKGIARVNLGTGAFVMAAIEKPDFAHGMLNSIVHWDKQAVYVLEGTVNGAGSALQWYAEKEGMLSVEKAVDHAVGSAKEPGLFLNGVGGLGSPDWCTDFKSEFLTAGDNDQNILAIVESIVFLLQRNLELIRQAQAIHCIVMSGGLSKQLIFCQLLADLSGLPVKRAMELEATARGACYILANYPENWRQAEMELFTPKDNRLLKSRFKQWSLKMEAALGEKH